MEWVQFRDLGTIGYQEAWDLQQTLLDELVARKRALRDSAEYDRQRLHYLLFCEHLPVYTLGKSGSISNLLLSESELQKRGIEYFPINRGGDITYHGPGQITGYPIFDLDGFFTDVHRYVRTLEEVVIRLLGDFELSAGRVEGYTGVWLPDPDRKICAIGVHLSRWVSMHGFALNVNTDLDYFNHIIPCGIDEPDKSVTSLAAELGREVSMDVVKERLRFHFKEQFGFQYLTE